MSNKAGVLFTNGNIYTVDRSDWDKNPVTSMVVDNNGKILAVGDFADCKYYVTEDTEVIDLGKKTIFPGFIDAHVHAPGHAFTELYQIDLNGLAIYDDVMDKIRSFINEHPEMDAYFGSGIKMGMTDAKGGPICSQWLDAVCDDKPITILSSDMHSLWLNTKAMEMCHITIDTEETGAGHIHRFADGTLTGVFTDTENIDFIDPVYSRQEKIEALQEFIGEMNRWGYTSIMSIPPYTFLECDRYMDIESRKALTLNVNCGARISSDSYIKDIENLQQLKKTFSSSAVRITTAKFFIDGVTEGKTAFMKKPYGEAAGMGPSYCGGSDWTPDSLKEACFCTMKSGFQTHMHTIGDAAVQMALDAIEYAQGRLNDNGYRNVLTHLQVIDENDKPRFAEQKVIAALQPFWHLKDPNMYFPIEEPYLGTERAEKEYPAKSLTDRGVVITSSGDYPISPNNNPFYGIQAGATRNVYCEDFGVALTDPDDTKYLLNKEERLTVSQMIEAYTINGAFQLFREDETGSLAPGKSADFVVIDRDVITGDIMDIHNAQIKATVLNGNVVYGAL